MTDDVTLLAESLPLLLDLRPLIQNEPRLAACRPTCVGFGTSVTGEVIVDLGALLALWHDETLVVPGPGDAPLHVFRLGGSPLSGNHRLRGIERATGAVVDHHLPLGVGFLDFFGPVAARARHLRTRDVPYPAPLAEVLDRFRA